ncbi:hypothetical protein Tco_0735287 [Tanacetum coccineum]
MCDISSNLFNHNLITHDMSNKMVEENISAPTRFDDQMIPALDITPVDPAHPFVSPSAGEQVMDFVNELGYPEDIHFVSKMHVNNLYQPWRATLTLINQCLTSKTSGSDKPRYPVLQMLLSIPSKKSTPQVIPYHRFTKLIIYYLGSRHNIHRRLESPVYITGDDFLLGNLKFVHKGEKDEVFGKPILKELIIEDIQTSPYYQQYLEMVARKPITKRDKQKKTASEADKPKKHTPVKKPAPISLQLVDEPDEEPQPAPEPQIEDDEYNLQRGIQMSLESFQVPVGGVAIHEPTSSVTRSLPIIEGKGKGIATDEQEASTGPSAQPEDDMSANIVRDTPSPPDAETGVEAEIHEALAGPNPEPIHEDFIAIVYPKVHESLKHTTEEHVFLENPPSSSGTLSSMKNLDDAFTYGDQFLYDKPTEEEPDKANLETKGESMANVPIHQASSTAPPLSTPIIDLTQSKPVSPPNQEPIFTAITETTTTTLPPPLPPQQQSIIDPALAARIDKYINENFKEAVQNALKAPVCERFRDLSEFKMKEILRDRMFESGSYRSQPEHTALYDALEASMDRENKEEFMDAMAKSRKRCLVMTKILLYLLQKTQTKLRRKGTILMHLLLNSLKLKRPQLGRLLTQEMLLPALQSKSLIPNLNSQLMTFQY